MFVRLKSVKSNAMKLTFEIQKIIYIKIDILQKIPHTGVTINIFIIKLYFQK